VFASIVVGTDGSESAQEAVRQAVELAARLGATLRIVSAYEPVPAGRLRDESREVPPDLQWMINPREDVDATLRGAAEAAREGGVEAETYARQGDPADAILDVAEEQGADLIVVGNKGMTGARRFLLGSVPNRVSHHAPCSVLIIRTM
jgi:nucleotide-binding universal stress UspA family protein